MPAGRPSKYKPEFCKRIVDYFSVPYVKTIKEQVVSKDGRVVEINKTVANDLPLFGMFANSIDVAQNNMLGWANTKIKTDISEEEEYKHPEFHIAFKKAKELQEAMWISNSMNGLYNTAFTIFLGKNIFRWRDRQEIENTHKGAITHIHNLDSYKKAKGIAQKYERELYTALKKTNAV